MGWQQKHNFIGLFEQMENEMFEFPHGGLVKTIIFAKIYNICIKMLRKVFPESNQLNNNAIRIHFQRKKLRLIYYLMGKALF